MTTREEGNALMTAQEEALRLRIETARTVFRSIAGVRDEQEFRQAVDNNGWRNVQMCADTVLTMGGRLDAAEKSLHAANARIQALAEDARRLKAGVDPHRKVALELTRDLTNASTNNIPMTTFQDIADKVYCWLVTGRWEDPQDAVPEANHGS